MSKPNNLYEQVVGITSELLGPASERFVARQIANHLHKDPQDITEEDLGQLIDWLKLSLALLTEDSQTLDSFAGNLHRLTEKR